MSPSSIFCFGFGHVLVKLKNLFLNCPPVNSRSPDQHQYTQDEYHDLATFAATKTASTSPTHSEIVSISPTPSAGTGAPAVRSTLDPSSFQRLAPVHHLIMEELLHISPFLALRLSKGLYDRAIPILYRKIIFDGEHRTPIDDWFIKDDDERHEPASISDRRLALLAHVKSLHCTHLDALLNLQIPRSESYPGTIGDAGRLFLLPNVDSFSLGGEFTEEYFCYLSLPYGHVSQGANGYNRLREQTQRRPNLACYRWPSEPYLPLGLGSNPIGLFWRPKTRLPHHPIHPLMHDTMHHHMGIKTLNTIFRNAYRPVPPNDPKYDLIPNRIYIERTQVDTAYTVMFSIAVHFRALKKALGSETALNVQYVIPNDPDLLELLAIDGSNRLCKEVGREELEGLKSRILVVGVDENAECRCDQA
ncbi:hypothetical protein IAU59_001191 [Kwoniella sp. CBS 9459]